MIQDCQSLGKRPQHRPKKRFKDNVKANLKKLDIDVNTWEELADDRPVWRKLVYEGCNRFEIERTHHAQIKRALRKNLFEEIPPDMVRDFVCDVCGKITLSKAGLASHKRSHLNVGHTCVTCGKTCKSYNGLRRHMKIH